MKFTVYITQFTSYTIIDERIKKPLQLVSSFRIAHCAFHLLNSNIHAQRIEEQMLLALNKSTQHILNIFLR